MRKLNKTGAVETIFFAVFFATIGAILVASVTLKEEHRARKAVEFCVADGNTQAFCDDKVANMTEEEILDSIRDDEPAPAYVPNGGNFVGGYM